LPLEIELPQAIKNGYLIAQKQDKSQLSLDANGQDARAANQSGDRQSHKLLITTNLSTWKK
jgi:hypothetical protein